MNALSLRLRTDAVRRIVQPRPLEAVAEVVDAEFERAQERVVTIRVEIAPALAAAPAPEPAALSLPRPSAFEPNSFDHLPLTAASTDLRRATRAYAAHANEAAAPPPRPGIVLRCRA